jgi:hypothetical protein
MYKSYILLFMIVFSSNIFSQRMIYGDIDHFLDSIIAQKWTEGERSDTLTYYKMATILSVLYQYEYEKAENEADKIGFELVRFIDTIGMTKTSYYVLSPSEKSMGFSGIYLFNPESKKKIIILYNLQGNYENEKMIRQVFLRSGIFGYYICNDSIFKYPVKQLSFNNTEKYQFLKIGLHEKEINHDIIVHNSTEECLNNTFLNSIMNGFNREKFNLVIQGKNVASNNVSFSLSERLFHEYPNFKNILISIVRNSYDHYLESSNKTETNNSIDFNIGIKLDNSIQFQEKLNSIKSDETKRIIFYGLAFSIIFRFDIENKYSINMTTGMFPLSLPSSMITDFGGWEIGFQFRKYFDDKLFNISTGIIFHINWGNGSQPVKIESPGNVMNDFDTHYLLGLGGGIKISERVNFDFSFWKIINEVYGYIRNSELIGYEYHEIPEKMHFVIRFGLIFMF